MRLASDRGAVWEVLNVQEAADAGADELLSPGEWGSAAPMFPGAARTVAAAVEARWPQATGIVAWRTSTGTTAICRGAEIELGSTDIPSDSDLLDSVVERMRPATTTRARQGDRPRAATAVTVPLIVEEERVGVLCVFGLPEAPGGAAKELLGCLASLLATVSHGEMHGERLAQGAEAFRREARTDPVTNVLNRLGFLDELEAHCAHANAAGYGDMLLLVDVRGLHEADGRYGYAAGDHLLCQVAEVLDTAACTQGAVGRVGHDQFAVVLCGDDPAARAATYVDEVQRALARRAEGRPAQLALQFAGKSLADVKTAEQALQPHRQGRAPALARAAHESAV